MIQQLILTLEKFYNFKSSNVALIEEYCIFEDRVKNEFLIKENTMSTDFYIILEGYTRTFFWSEKGEEITTEISLKGDLVASMYSILKKEKAFENIQCITNCKVCKISEKNLEALCKKHPEYFELSLKFLKYNLLKKEEHIRDSGKLKSIDRYKKLLNTKPDIMQHVPVKYVASYIGIKPESLSRLRKEVAKSLT